MTSVVGAVLLGLFAIHLGLIANAAGVIAVARAPGAVFASSLGLRAAIDLGGMAIAGGLFIVPAFAAVQAWSDAAYRARTMAAVNVLNAAFMTGATVAIALMQKAGATCRCCS